MNAFPHFQRGGESPRSRIEIWSVQIDPPRTTGKCGGRQFLDGRKREDTEVTVTSDQTDQLHRAVSVEKTDPIELVGDYSIGEALPLLRTSPTEPRIAFGFRSSQVAVDLVPERITTEDLAVADETVGSAGPVHRRAINLYARAATFGYPERQETIGACLDARV
jgi:hypothetical protein